MTIDAARLQPFLTRPISPFAQIRGQNRLEGRPRQPDFARALRAEVRDPLWFLTRQWQFGEFRAEDAGSPIDARVALRRTPVPAYAPRQGPLQAIAAELPLEAIVERERIPGDLTTHVQIYRAMVKLLAAGGLADPHAAAVPALVRAFPLAGAVDGAADGVSAAMLALGAGKFFNGLALLAVADKPALASSIGAVTDAATAAAIVAAGPKLRSWFDEVYLVDSAASPGAWSPPDVEYRFRVATPGGAAQPTELVAGDYGGGRVDWYAFDTRPLAVPAPGVAEPDVATTLSFVPAPVAYAGMPSPRYWEMEDRKTEFGDLTIATTDVAKLLLAEFALVFANDWCIVPHEAPVGSIIAVEGLVVTDVFGDRILIEAAGRGADEDWRRWSLYGLSTPDPDAPADMRLYLPPATAQTLEGAPIEEVVLLRDEMANMAWAVERIVESAIERPRNRFEEPQDGGMPPVSAAQSIPSYRLASTTPDNWVPLLPVQTDAGLRLTRGKVVKPDGTQRLIEAKGRLLNPDGNPAAGLMLYEEEIPREGVRVTRSYQLARWQDGSTHLWIGRRKRIGRGEGSSGLQFDRLVGPAAKSG
jgi:hypothetical protein